MFSSPKTVFLCVAYKNFSYMDSKPLTWCIKHQILALVLTEITFIVSFKHTNFMESYIFLLKRQEEY
jgi:hypothetical protein